MEDPFCACIYKTFVDEPVSTYSTILELLFSVGVSICGILVNSRFLRKLKEEKQETPLGRKGNVIEPIMSWYCKFQIIYWPYHLLYFWLNQNEIISNEFMYHQSWFCDVLTLAMRFGRVCIAYTSFFVSFIRYLYIVHQQKANQWEYENVARRFVMASICVPLAIEAIGTLTNPYTEYLSTDELNSCVDFWQSLNTTENVEIPTAKAYKFTTRYLPEKFVIGVYYTYASITGIIFLNIADAFLYFKIFQSIKRLVFRFE